MRRLLDALRDSIEVDLSPASESEASLRLSPTNLYHSFPSTCSVRFNRKLSIVFKPLIPPILKVYNYFKLIWANSEMALAIIARAYGITEWFQWLQVRRKADPAKSLVKEWVQNWRDATAVSNDPSYRRITGLVPSLRLSENHVEAVLCPRVIPVLG